METINESDGKTNKLEDANLLAPYTNLSEVSEEVNAVNDFMRSKVDHELLAKASDISIAESIKRSSEGVTTLGKKEIYNLDKKNTLENGTLYFEGKKFGTINEKTRLINIDRENGLNSKGINTFLSHTQLAPNVTYDINHGLNRTIYKTDGIGRCNSIENIAKETGNARSISDQVKALRTKSEQTTPYTNPKINDQGGHYIASCNGGIPESINIFPQAHKVNNGTFREMEKTIKKAIDQGKSVETNIAINYRALSNRPDSLTYKVQVDGGNIMEFKYDNINLTQKELNALK